MWVGILIIIAGCVVHVITLGDNMRKNVYDMIDEVMKSTQELTNDFITKDNIVMNLNKGLTDLLDNLSKHNCSKLVKKKTDTLLAGVSEYNLPNDIVGNRVNIIRVKDGTDWLELEEKFLKDETDLMNLTSASTPEYYIISGNKINIYPKPSNEIVDGLEIVYGFDITPFSLPLGRITKILGNKIYVDTLDINSSDGNVKFNFNDYVTITSSLDKDTYYTFRIRYYDVTEGYLEVYTGMNNLTISSINLSENSITLANTPDISEVVFNDILYITGSLDNDLEDGYTVIGVDSDTYKIYLREPLTSTDITGTINISLPDKVLEHTILTNPRILNYKDLVCTFDTAGANRLDKLQTDYIIQYAIIECLKEAKEPTQEEIVKLQKLFNDIVSTSANRNTPVRFRLRKEI